jgi:hypothetical protein
MFSACVLRRKTASSNRLSSGAFFHTEEHLALAYVSDGNA